MCEITAESSEFGEVDEKRFSLGRPRYLPFTNWSSGWISSAAKAKVGAACGTERFIIVIQKIQPHSVNRVGSPFIC